MWTQCIYSTQRRYSRNDCQINEWNYWLKWCAEFCQLVVLPLINTDIWEETLLYRTHKSTTQLRSSLWVYAHTYGTDEVPTPVHTEIHTNTYKTCAAFHVSWQHPDRELLIGLISVHVGEEDSNSWKVRKLCRAPMSLILWWQTEPTEVHDFSKELTRFMPQY